VAVFTRADVPGENTFGPIFHDEELLAGDVCHHIGQPIVALAGTDRQALRAAKAAVRLDLEELPAVLTIDEAVARPQFSGPTRRSWRPWWRSRRAGRRASSSPATRTCRSPASAIPTSHATTSVSARTGASRV